MSSKSHDFDGFVGDFKELLINFVQMKQSLGFDYTEEANALKRFSRFTLNFDIDNHALTKELVDAWTAKRPAERDVTWEHRINNLKQFAIFLTNLGYKAHIPVCKAKIDRNKYVPYIFTTEELQRIFTQIDSIEPYPRSNRYLVFPALYRILYGCGLRISEALALKLKDVDLGHGTVRIIGSKFDKDRFVPMSPSLTRHLQEYFQRLPAVATSGDYFFMKSDRTAFTSNTVYRHFRQVLWRSGISHGGKGRGPRLHDMRHTFSVHALNQMVRLGMDLYCALPILSTYLGHASVAATERYVRLTEEAYPGILDIVSRTCAYVFPEVKI
ncbi:MAG: tyrosine-type recombinase/integrase [Desulfomonilaceae bacterium]